MEKDKFDQLVESIKQAGKIKRGELNPAREFHFTPADIKEIRSRMNKSQTEFALMIGVKVSTLQQLGAGTGKTSGRSGAGLCLKLPPRSQGLLLRH